MFDNKTILVTGGTGSFGKHFVKTLLDNYSPKKVIIFSRDELKQFEFSQTISSPLIRFFIGDIRDLDRLRMAFNGVDIVVHAAAMKQVPASEYNPFEAIKTNIIGAQNIITAALEQKVNKVVALSTDKAVNPINLYGATKLCSDKLFINAKQYVKEGDPTQFCVVRYGNVVGSRGSVIPFFLKKKSTGILPITDERMTRFWITLSEAVNFVINAIKRMDSGEIYIPKLPTMKITDLARAIGPECKQTIIGIRPGEKIHEVLLTEDESRDAYDLGDCYMIKPRHIFENLSVTEKKVPENFYYESNNTDRVLTTEELQAMLKEWKENYQSYSA